jgi:hypothetical protein
MSDDAPTSKSRVAEYREQARRTRDDAGAIEDALLRQQMLDIADQFDQLADSIERARFGGS